MGFASRRGHDGVMAHEPTPTLPFATLEAMLAQASVVEHRARPGVVGIGSVVTVDDTDNGAGARYRLVGSHEAQDPATSRSAHRSDKHCRDAAQAKPSP